jgi:hypothetical protein
MHLQLLSAPPPQQALRLLDTAGCNRVSQHEISRRGSSSSKLPDCPSAPCETLHNTRPVRQSMLISSCHTTTPTCGCLRGQHLLCNSTTGTPLYRYQARCQQTACTTAGAAQHRVHHLCATRAQLQPPNQRSMQSRWSLLACQCGIATAAAMCCSWLQRTAQCCRQLYESSGNIWYARGGDTQPHVVSSVPVGVPSPASGSHIRHQLQGDTCKVRLSAQQ